MRPCPYRQLSENERRRIDRLLGQRHSVGEIARIVGRHRSTIYRELRRNRFVDHQWPELNGYYYATAGKLARDRRARMAKLVRHDRLRVAIVDRLKDGWSPEQIAGRLRREGSSPRVSHETIYRFAYSPSGLSSEIFRLLPESRRRRRPRRARGQRGLQVPDSMSIAHRPAPISGRQEFGHWEGDLLMFRKEHGKANVTSLVERVSRYTVLLRNTDRRSLPIMESVIVAFQSLPRQARSSFTFDRGTEFSAWDRLDKGLGANTWFCDPRSPWQKGAVENANRRLRQQLPSETNLIAISQIDLTRVASRMNATPRKCLGYKTPAEVFRDYLIDKG